MPLAVLGFRPCLLEFRLLEPSGLSPAQAAQPKDATQQIQGPKRKALLNRAQELRELLEEVAWTNFALSK